jgi:hypothetical protein
MARTFSPDVMLGGWLHRHTCFVASKVMRGERRRQDRERQAVEMNAMEDHSAADLKTIAPILDDAINQLADDDRKAILLRFFDEHDFRSVGQTLGSSEEAARKRVNRALEKLHASLSRQGVSLSLAALGSALATHAVSAAPAGMAIGIAATALAGAATTGTLSLTILKIMSMTKVKVAVATAVVLAVAAPYVMQQKAQSKLRAENESLRERVAQMDQLLAENERLSKLATASGAAVPATNDPSREVLKLRGEVGRLRQENASVAASIAEPKGPSALSGITANPEMLKAIREQQKMGLGAVYKDFAKRAKLSSEQGDKFVDALADNVMANVEQIQMILRDRASPEERDRLFAAQETALQEQLQGLLGPEGMAQYQEYTRNLASYLTAEQFKALLTGEKSAKEEQGRQLFELMQEEAQRALQSAGLPPDYQLVPTLSFRNIASEEEGEKTLKLLDSIYGRVGERATSFLSPEELEKFGQFRTSAISGNRVALAINRRMMAPSAK